MSFTLTFDPDELDGQKLTGTLYVAPWTGGDKKPARAVDGRGISTREVPHAASESGTFAVELPSVEELVTGYWVRFGDFARWRVYVPAQPAGARVALTDPRWWATAGTPPTQSELAQTDERIVALEIQVAALIEQVALLSAVKPHPLPKSDGTYTTDGVAAQGDGTYTTGTLTRAADGTYLIGA